MSPQAQAIDYQQLAMALVREKAVSSTATNVYAHGPGGLFSPLGLSKNIFNAMILPNLGLQQALQVRTTNEINPLYGIVTGTTATSGSQPTGQCDDPKTAGLMKLCTQSAVLGHMSLQTQVFNIKRVGERVNRGEFYDLRLVGNPVNNTQWPKMTGAGLEGSVIDINSQSAKSAFELASSWAKEYAPLLYAGNPTNNTSGGGYEEYRGLDILINTGYRDAITGIACPAADSIVQPFNNQRITNASADIVGTIQDVFFRLRTIAARAGMGNVKWAISMPYGMFYRLSEVWAYYYFSRALDGLTFNSALHINLGGEGVTKLRDEMRGNLETRTGQFLWIDGTRVEVYLDDAIDETSVSAGVFSADIYIVPLTSSITEEPLTYMEYYNWDSPGGSLAMARLMAPGDSYYTTDNGMYFWHRKPPTNLCVQVAVWSQPRVILRTPYLAARITDVAWAPETVHERQPFNDDPYFVDGGNSNYRGWGPSYWSPTA